MGAAQSSEGSTPIFTAQLAYEDPYVQPLLIEALKARLPASSYELVTNTTSPKEPLKRPLLQILPYEQISFELALQNPNKMLINAYVIRKALIRKHFLAATVARWITKRPNSVLKNHVKVGVRIDIDYAEYMEEALSDAWEVRESIAKNEELPLEQREWWILKPGMADGGNGIRLFSTEDELRGIFEEFEGGDSEDENENEEDEDGYFVASGNVYASQLRYFVAQQYIHPPLLFDSSGGRKFHIRTYVLAVGALKVYVYRPMLALFAAAKYQAPWENSDLRGHLTNTCLQGSNQREGTVQAFWDLDDKLPGSGKLWKEDVFSQICSTTGELFEAGARNEMVHFQTLPNAFEIFGVDFMVDAEGTAWLLEVNAFPDFKQTGDELKVFVSCLLGDTAELAVKPFFYPEAKAEEDKDGRMIKVLDIDLGRR
jgi:tubulin--tyrosine ligase